MRRAPGVVLTALCLAGALLTWACGSAPSVSRRVIVLGFDGLDYDLTRQLIEAGELPAFAELADAGGFSSLGTTIPPQSPVAWSSFITGLDPGGHGIFDFVHRDPQTMLPYLSTTRTEPGEHAIGIGRWQLPLSGGRVELLRRGRPFWEVLEEHGVPATIMRMPANFPPSGVATRELSGMGTPDLLGTYGTFAYYTSEPYAFVDQTLSGGVVQPVRVREGVVRAVLEGPDNPFLREPQKVRAEFTAHVDDANRHVKIVVGDEERLLAIGEWSDWVPVSFALAPTQSLAGEVRFFLKGLDPFFQLYTSPINMDPAAPAMPVSHPPAFASELAEATGRFYTQGMPEDTNALKTGVLSEDEFLAQAAIAAGENLRQYRYVLDRFEAGLLFYYFGNVDQVSHMMWRARDPAHPAYDAGRDRVHADVVETLYRELDAVVADTLARLGPDDLLVVMSDHGFTSWRRAFHLNTWLRDHGYLAVIDPNLAEDPGLYANVDWSKTRAYGLGLNGLYINLRGRERDGVVDQAAREPLVREIGQKLLATIDPSTGQPAVNKVYRREEAYRLDGYQAVAPDLVIGYAKGTRSSDESALGGLTREVMADNTSPWSGDHCMDHTTVPGILLASRPLVRQATSIQDLAASLLAEFGITGFPGAEDD